MTSINAFNYDSIEQDMHLLNRSIDRANRCVAINVPVIVFNSEMKMIADRASRIHLATLTVKESNG